ncbi:MAG: CBS domain-containing protein [Leptolyngbya sp. SIO4C5]|nr:CBS domain-containing protein [Leptolyngbya sp. SIO4C5]
MALFDSSADLPVLADVVNYHPLTVAPETPLPHVLPLIYRADLLCLLTCGITAPLPPSSTQPEQPEESENNCVVVVEQAAVVGILTSQDLVHLGAMQVDLERLQVGQVMTRSPITLILTAEQTLFQALLLLKQYRIHHLPVLNQAGRLIGMVTAASIHQALQGNYFLRCRQVADAMTTRLVQVAPTASLLRVAQQMDRHQVSCVVITPKSQIADKQQPLGLITAGDVVQCLRLGCSLTKTQAQTLMSSPPFWITPATSLWSAHQQMQQRHIHQLLVCDEKGYWLGMVTQTDVLQSMNPDQLLSIIQDLQQTVEAQTAALQTMRADVQGQLAQPRGLEERLQPSKTSLAKDMTERQQAEQALRQSEERWQLMLQGNQEDIRDNEERYRQLAEKLQLITTNAPVYIYELDRDGCITFANHIYPGLTLDQVLGTRLSDWFSQPQQQMIEQTLARVFERQQTEAIAYEVPDPQGQLRAYEARIAPILVNGVAASAVLIANDITERKQAEAKLKEQAALIDIATDAILVRNLDDEVIFWSQGAERIYGWSASAALGKKLSHLLNQKLSPELHTAWKTVLARGEWQGELQKCTQSGTMLTIESRWTLVRDQQGQPQSILSVDTDITERRQLEGQFFRAQRLESLGTLAGGIAHDLNNLMTPILGISHLLSILLKGTDQKTQELLDIQLASVRRGTALVKQILAFARGAEGKRTVLQLRHVLNEVRTFTAKTFPKSISIQADLAKDLWTIQGDATHLHQVLMNLCVNARDAMPEGGSLTLLAENLWFDEAQAQQLLDAQPGPYVVVTVADTGMGIAPEIVDRIFDPFFTTKAAGTGTGLGLSTTVGIVKSHNGFITVSSQVGQGTEFKVYLPAIATQPTPTPMASAHLPKGNGEKVLVVDDETAICRVTQSMLETHNYRVLTATTGQEAIALYQQQQAEISAVLVDLMMPVLDGVSTIRTLQTINPQVKIIALSGLEANLVKLKTAGPSVQAVLHKPYSLDDLLPALHQVLSGTAAANTSSP